jgi:thiol-disulfide isomerase/thioredoxin
MRFLVTIAAFIIPILASSQIPVDSNWIATKYLPNFSSDTGVFLRQVKLVDEKGDRKTLADFKGKILYINVWHTGCAASIDMFPYEAQLMKRLRSIHLDTSVQVIDICSGTSEKKWRKMLAKHQPETVNLFLKNRKKWGIKRWPTYILLDANGKVIGRQISSPDEFILINYILYAATKGVGPIQAAWTQLTRGKFNGVTTMNEKEQAEYMTWERSLGESLNEFFQWRKEYQSMSSN